jgi:hypothetical protein
MTCARIAAVIIVAAAFLLPASARAQAPVASFDQLSTRLKPGDRVWVTDAKGHEVEGRIQSLSAEALKLDAGGSRTFAAHDVSLIRDQQRDSLKNGALIGLGAGGALALTWCLSAAADDSPDVSAGVECTEGAIAFAGLGTLFGLAIDASMPGKMRVAYKAPGPASAPGHARLSIAPIVTRRTTGLAVSFAF